MDKKILFVLFLLLGSVLVAAYIRGNFSSAKTAGAKVRVGEHEFSVEVAETMPQQARGLSGHAPLGPDEGMIFLFSHASQQAFWMKDMLFPIDIIWIKDGRVVGFVESAPVADGARTPTFASPGPVDTALEVSAGTVRVKQIKVGDIVLVKR